MPSVEVLTAYKPPFDDVGWNSDYGNDEVIGRLRPGITAAAAQAQLDTIDRQIMQQAPPGQFASDSASELASAVVPLKEAIVGRTSRALWLLFATVLSVLLIACMNLANVQLARAVARDRELAVRVALGASMRNLQQTTCAEIALFTACGGALGVLLAEFVVHCFACHGACSCAAFGRGYS